jgi:histidyl-tRNA synthetase
MIQKPKGTYDVYGKQGKIFQELEKLMNALMENYNYEYIRTPHFEASELFHRGVGETTDIVSKETYDFKDRSDRNMTLRPEGTAGVVRSYIENKMYGDTIVPRKLWYFGPMYRYERPQSGRFREFYQFGVEVFGTNSPMMDAEVISIPVNFYRLLGLKGIKVHINTLGDKESRENYRNALLEYFKPYLDELCDDCKTRYEKNPLRILDCKIDSSKDIMKNAPKIKDYLNEKSKKHYEDVKKYLDALKIEYIEDSNLVRGLDYYTHTVFEVEASVEGFGSQNVLCGGGRYDHLVETLGGPATSGVGFAMGLERLITALSYENIDIAIDNGLDVYIIPMEDTLDYAISLTNDLRLSGFKVETDYMNRKLQNNFKQADRLNAKFIIIIGSLEKESNILTIKNNHTKEEYKIKLEELINFLDDNLDSCECEECNHE